MLISGGYREVLREMHARKPHWGVAGKMYEREIDRMAARFDCRTFLDYGCGKRTMSTFLPHLDFKGYDPGVEEYSAQPSPADMVICLDVLEHVEPGCLHDVLDHLKNLTKKVFLASIATSPANKHLPDGRNAHLIVEQPRWWLPQLMDRWSLQKFLRGDDSFYVVMT